MSDLRSDLGKWPWATIFAVLITIVLGITSLVEPDDLSFDKYTTYVVVVWSFLAIGRGAALKEQSMIELAPFSRFLNTFPWATVVTAVVAVVGYIGTLSDSLTIEELGLKLSVLIGALGLGRGLGVLKKDALAKNDVPFEDFPEDGAIAASATEDEDLGAEDEPIKAPPLGSMPPTEKGV